MASAMRTKRSSAAPTQRASIGALCRRALGAAVKIGVGGRVVAIALLAAVVYLRVVDPTPVTMLRFQYFDLMQRIDPREPYSDQVAIVDIDEHSIGAFGQWPWSRDRLAVLVERLKDAGALAIGFDIVFSEPDRLSPSAFAETAEGLPPMVRGLLAGLPDTDDAFAAAVGEAPVVLGMGSSVETLSEAGNAPLFSPTDLSAVATMVEVGGDPRPFLFSFPDVLRNIPELERTASGIGMFSLVPEHDGVVRRVPAAVNIGGTLIPPLSLEMMRVALDAQHHVIHRHADGVGIQHVSVRDIVTPTDWDARIWLHYAEHDPTLYVSALDILGDQFSLEALRDDVAGKFVLVGTSAIGLRDLRLTPLNDTIPGVEVHAQLIDTMLSGEHLTRPIFASALEHACAMLAGILFILFGPGMSAGRALALFGGIVAVYAGGAFLAFSQASLALDATYPLMAALATFGAVAFAAFNRAEAQKRQIRAAFSQYLAPAMVEKLADDPESLRLGGESREMTFLFCDIAGFTSFVETAEPADLVALLNEYLDGVCQIVMDNNGAVDKIVGDAVHAMFNAPMDDPDHAANAVRAAIQIEAFVNDFRERKARDGFNFGTTRIGVNTGRVIVGNFGGASRFDYTAHGDAINTAARLEGVNKHLGTTICVSGTTAQLCQSTHFRPVGTLYLKGKDVPLDAYEPVRGDAADTPEIQFYADAFERLRADAPDAGEVFRALGERFPQDPLVALHLSRLNRGDRGVEIRMSEK